VVEVANIALRLVTLPGVFSHGELDEGTRFLLENMPLLPPKARVHDFGCGCGIIGTWLKLRQPTLDLTLSDVDALAFASAKATLASNRLLGVPVHLAEGLAPIPGPLDIIVSNPPFHQGQRTDRSVVTELITTARKKLRRGGKLIVVANRFLPYKADMEQQIGPTRILADSPQFWVLETTGK
jgi:16S rRNA (guanine1207-N2)-methyltransferase